MIRYFRKQRCSFLLMQRRWNWGKALIWLLFPGLIIGCTPMIRQEPPTLSGTFSGSMPDGSPLTITFNQEENTVSGHGTIGEKSFSLSALASWHGPMVVAFEEGNVTPAHVTLSPDGRDVTINWFGRSVNLQRGGELIQYPSGSFAGTYSMEGPPPLWLTLTQGGDLLAGTGFLNGKPVAVVGKITEPKRAKGSVMFSDESGGRVKAILSDNGKTIIIQGLGADLKLRRTNP